jgi:thymidylate synthase (FAD)
VQVTLINHTFNSGRPIAIMTRVSYSASNVDEVSAKLTSKQVDSLFRHLISAGHFSSFEHINFMFAIDGISRITSHQLARNCMASYIQHSQRYVILKKPEYMASSTISAH